MALNHVDDGQPSALDALPRRTVLAGTAGLASLVFLGKCDSPRSTGKKPAGKITVKHYLKYPNVLVVTGDLDTAHEDPAKGVWDPRKLLKAALQHDTNSPVRVGTHDFWCVFGVPDHTFGGEAGTNFGERGGNVQLRGVTINGKAPLASPDGNLPATLDQSQRDALVDGLRVVMEEVAHYWLVHPEEMSFIVDGISQQIDVDDFLHINHDQPFTGPLLIGRELLHWGAYFQADASPLDGIAWSMGGKDGALDRWEARKVRLPVSMPWGTLEIRAPYNDLDLVLMGLLRPQDAYPETNNYFHWLEPVYTAPVNYMAGIFVGWGQFDFMYFGFDNDHRKLGVYRTDGSRYGYEPVDLGPLYDPYPPVSFDNLGNTRTGVALRVVSSAGQLHFQARFDDAALTARTRSDGTVYIADSPDRISGIFDGLLFTGEIIDPPATAGDFTGWRTVATLTTNVPPAAIGLIAKTGDLMWLDAVFSHVETYTKRRGAEPTHKTTKLNYSPNFVAVGTDFRSLPATPSLQAAGLPPSGMIFPDWLNRLRLRPPAYLEDWPDATPWPSDVPPRKVDKDGQSIDLRDPPFDHTASQDKAPKLIMKAPTGAFAFGTSVAIRRTVFRRSSGGAADGLQFWGHPKRMRATDMRVFRVNRDRVPTEDWKMRVAFILCSPNDNVPLEYLASMELLRQGFEKVFPAATVRPTTSGLAVDTTLDWPS